MILAKRESRPTLEKAQAGERPPIEKLRLGIARLGGRHSGASSEGSRRFEQRELMPEDAEAMGSAEAHRRMFLASVSLTRCSSCLWSASLVQYWIDRSHKTTK